MIRTSFTLPERVYAWLCLLAGWLFWELLPLWEKPVACALLVAGVYGVSGGLLLARKRFASPLALGAALWGQVLGCGGLICGNSALRFLSLGGAVLLFAYGVYTACGNGEGLRQLLPDCMKALILAPFVSFGTGLRAMLPSNCHGFGKGLGKLLLGLFLTLIPTALVLLLLSYDARFCGLLESLFRPKSFSLPKQVFHVLLGLPLGLCLFSLYISSTHQRCAAMLTRQDRQTAARGLRQLSALSVAAGVLPLLVLYLIFFVSQWTYYSSGFTGVLPQGFSYAAYAREGFFQLCAVACINLLVVWGMLAFMKREKKGESRLCLALVLTFSLVTWVLIATALSKLMLYIDSYGLTPKRVYAAVMMVFLTAVFLLLALGQFVKRLPVGAVSALLALGLLTLLSFSNVDGRIAEYNVARYLQGSLEEVDVEAMEDLGLSAVPSLVHLEQALKEEGQEEALWVETHAFLDRCQKQLREADPLAWSMPRQRAQKALAERPRLPSA